MKTLLLTGEKVGGTTGGGRMLVHDEAFEGWRVEKVAPSSLGRTTKHPDVTLVQVGDATQPRQLKSMMRGLARIQSRNPGGSYVVFALKNPAGIPTEASGAPEAQMQAVLDEIHSGLPQFPHPDRVDISIVGQEGSDLAVKLRLIEAKLKQPPPTSGSLGQVRDVVKATGDLRTDSGNLSAQKIAEVFGVSLNQVAGWLGRTRQALSKTPDANSIQNDLAAFERIARLRAVLPGNDFRKWLRMPNRQLDMATPLDLLPGEERDAVADLVEDMLTGTPA